MNGNRYGQLAALLCAAALLLAGCGGGGGEPTVTQAVHDELLADLQAELDAALADLAGVRAELADSENEAERLEGELTTSQASVARLQTRIATAEANVADLTAQLATATTNAADLAADLLAAQGEVADLTDDLADANAEVANLEAAIGMATDAANASTTASLYAQLNAAMDEAARLEGLIGNAADPASLQGRLADARAEVARLEAALSTSQTALSTAQDRVTELETLVGDATNPTPTSLRGQIAQLTIDLAAEEARADALETQLSTAETNLAASRQAAEEARQQAQQQAQQAADLEANQRAANLKRELEANRVGTTAATSPVTEVAPTPGTLRFTRGGHNAATVGGSGIRGATLRLTAGADSGKTVVYTDYELTRTLLRHYATSRDSSLTQLDIADTDLGTGVTITGGEISEVSPVWDISHGVRTSLGGVHVDDDNDPGTPVSDDDGTAGTDPLVRPANPDDPAPRTSYSGSLHGVQGTFVCGGDCQIQLTPNYEGTHDAGTPGNSTPGNSFDLQSVTLANVGGTGLFFRPSSSTASVNLCNSRSRCTAGGDNEYMLFGFWREDPTSPAGVYEFGVFAEVKDLTGNAPAGGFTGTVIYDGDAVGAYVEQDPNDPVDTHRQGEFTADVFLEATSATAVTGTIDDFIVTPTGGSAAPRTSDRWVVTLADDNGVTINLGAGGAGMWTHAFVPHHEDASADAQAAGPPAVTGVFDVAVQDFVHILGAFGAEKR